MRALVYNDTTGSLQVDEWATPSPGPDEALIRVLRAGVCSTDLEITKGYVPGFHHALGHEFVGLVEACSSQPHLIGKRVVGEINCNICNFTCADAVFQRNHAPGRTVLGIIGKDGSIAEYVTLPARNLHVVPDVLTDVQACYAEPLAAAARVLEQGIPKPGNKVAVIGDGKLGLLLAAVIALGVPSVAVTLFGRHPQHMSLVPGLAATHHVTDSSGNIDESMAGAFDVAVEASGSAGGVRLALALLRPLGSLVLKTTVSTQKDAAAAGGAPAWSDVANDIVVNEKILIGSRCGPMDVALKLMEEHAALRELLGAMTAATVPLEQAADAIQLAAQKGTLKVQVICS